MIPSAQHMRPVRHDQAAFFQKRGRGLRQASVLVAFHVALHAGLKDNRVLGQI
jgi:hypothetical protein